MIQLLALISSYASIVTTTHNDTQRDGLTPGLLEFVNRTYEFDSATGSLNTRTDFNKCLAKPTIF